MKQFAGLFCAGLAFAGAVSAVPAFADVKQGVDAWHRGDYAEAVSAWRPLAIAGDADAQFNLGQAYKLGRGVATDLKQAEHWYQKAALQGHQQAEDRYGLVLFQNGNRKEALPWLEKSVARGEPRAQYVLGTALFNGDIAGKDWVRAYALMTRASAAGLSQASLTLAQMDQYIPLDQRQKGLILARELDMRLLRPEAPAIIARAELPPSTAAIIPASFTKEAPEVAVKTAEAPPQPTPEATPQPQPAAKPAPAALPAPVAKPDGDWRVQLGAFSDQARAKVLWASLQPKVRGLGGIQPHYVKAGALTRLQAGSFEDKSAADRQCAAIKAAGQACLTVKP